MHIYVKKVNHNYIAVLYTIVCPLFNHIYNIYREHIQISCTYTCIYHTICMYKAVINSKYINASVTYTHI